MALDKVIYQEENIILAGHGTWLGVILNYFDDSYDYEHWQNIKMPDIYLNISKKQLKTINKIDYF